MNMLRVTKLDEVWAKVDCEPGQCQEISDLLTFDVPQARFMPSYQKKYWECRSFSFPKQNRDQTK